MRAITTTAAAPDTQPVSLGRSLQPSRRLALSRPRRQHRPARPVGGKHR